VDLDGVFRIVTIVAAVMNGSAGVWGLLAHRDEKWRLPAFWPATYAAQGVLVLQVVLGALIIRDLAADERGLEPFYLFGSFAAVGILHAYRQQIEEWRFLLYGFGGLFLMGMSLRALALV